MIEGSMADWRFRVAYGDPAKMKEDEEDGCCIYDSEKMQAEILLHPNLGAIAHVNLVFHELGHLLKQAYHVDLSHRDIFNIAAAFTQALVTSGIINPLEIEARIRANAEKSEER